ncbi:unnamed protein product, partial [marine sediment metagenome]
FHSKSNQFWIGICYSALEEIGLPPTIFRDKTLHLGGNHN